MEGRAFGAEGNNLHRHRHARRYIFKVCDDLHMVGVQRVMAGDDVSMVIRSYIMQGLVSLLKNTDVTL